MRAVGGGDPTHRCAMDGARAWISLEEKTARFAFAARKEVVAGQAGETRGTNPGFRRCPE